MAYPAACKKWVRVENLREWPFYIMISNNITNNKWSERSLD